MFGWFRHKDDPAVVLAGTVLAGYLMAGADGRIADEELDLIVSRMHDAGRTDIRREQIPPLVMRALSGMRLRTARYWHAAFSMARTQSRPARLIMFETALVVAVMQGEFTERERAMAVRICGWLGLTGKDMKRFFDDMLTRNRDRLRQ